MHRDTRFSNIPSLCLLIGPPWLPESPRHLFANDQLEKEFAILKRLHNTPRDDDDTIAREELYQIRRQLELERQEGWRQGYIKDGFYCFNESRIESVCCLDFYSCE